MNKLEFEGTWKEVKGKLKKKYAVLTDNDLAYEEGQEDQLLGHLQQKLGESKDKIRKLISDI